MSKGGAQSEGVSQLAWRQVQIDGGSTRYAVGGHGPPVLFIHGWGLSARAYTRPLQQLIRAHVQVWAPALPGFGGTTRLPAGRRTLSGYAEWVGKFADATELPRPATVVGHSFGGGVAIATVYRRPELCERLVLVNSIGGSAWTDGRGAIRAMRDRPLWDWGLHLPADLLPGRQLTRVLPVIVRDAVPNLLRNPTAVWQVSSLARTANLAPELTALAERRLPVFVVWSKRDTIIPESTTMSLRAALGDPNTITAPGGHAWLIDDPRSFGELITNVMRQPLTLPPDQLSVAPFPESVAGGPAA